MTSSERCLFPDDQSSVERDLPSGLSLILGPLRPEQRVVAHFLVDRIAAAVTIAARRDEAARPRGSRRVEAVEALLAGRSGSASEQRAAALALGLDPDAIFFVIVSSGEDDATLTNALAPLGTPSMPRVWRTVDGHRWLRLAARAGPESLLSRVAEAKRRWHDETAEITCNTCHLGAGFGSRSLAGGGERGGVRRDASGSATVPASRRLVRLD